MTYLAWKVLRAIFGLKLAFAKDWATTVAKKVPTGAAWIILVLGFTPMETTRIHVHIAQESGVIIWGEYSATTNGSR